jgi:hypothetical protein
MQALPAPAAAKLLGSASAAAVAAAGALPALRLLAHDRLRRYAVAPLSG